VSKNKVKKDMQEFVVTGIFPAMALEDGIKSFTVNHMVSAYTKQAACREFKRFGVVQIAEGRFLNTASAVMIVASTEHEFEKARNEQKALAEANKVDEVVEKSDGDNGS